MTNIAKSGHFTISKVNLYFPLNFFPAICNLFGVSFVLQNYRWREREGSNLLLFFCKIMYVTRSLELHYTGLVLRLPGMSTKQPAVDVVSRSNQRSPLSLLRPLLVRSVHQAFNVVNLSSKCSKHEAFHFREESLERVFLYLKSVRM